MNHEEASRHLPPPVVTHLELRRVQNGFVVMALNLAVREDYGMGESMQRASFIAKDIPELANILQALIDGAELRWLATADLPLIDLSHRRQLNPAKEQSAMETIASSLHEIRKSVGL